jgi:hypothetical protein
MIETVKAVAPSTGNGGVERYTYQVVPWAWLPMGAGWATDVLGWCSIDSGWQRQRIVLGEVLVRG